jgi:type IV fimbrial biogenesis protein FimT
MPCRRLPLRRAGFSLIELMISLVVLMTLLAAGMPALGTWAADSRIRGVAESLQNGLRVAQAAAIAHNRQAVFALTASTPALTAPPVDNGSNWYARLLPLPGSDESDDSTADADAHTRYLQGSSYGRESGVSIQGPALLCFGSLGQQVSLDSGSTGLDTACSSGRLVTYTVTDGRSSSAHTLQVQVNLGGQVRMCDPARQLSDDHPDGC